MYKEELISKIAAEEVNSIFDDIETDKDKQQYIDSLSKKMNEMFSTEDISVLYYMTFSNNMLDKMNQFNWWLSDIKKEVDINSINEFDIDDVLEIIYESIIKNKKPLHILNDVKIYYMKHKHPFNCHDINYLCLTELKDLMLSRMTSEEYYQYENNQIKKLKEFLLLNS